MFSWGKGETVICFLLLVELSVFVEFDVRVWHGSSFIQTVVIQGLSSIQIVEVELCSITAAFAGWWFSNAPNIKNIE